MASPTIGCTFSVGRIIVSRASEQACIINASLIMEVVNPRLTQGGHVNTQFLFIAHNGHWIIASTWEKSRAGRKRDRERERQEASKVNSVETGCLILHYRPIGNVIENTEARLRCQYKSTIKHLHFTYLYSTRERETYFLFYERIVSRVSFVEREVGGENWMEIVRVTSEKVIEARWRMWVILKHLIWNVW